MTLTDDGTALRWVVNTLKTLVGIDRDVFLEFTFPAGTSSSQIVFAVDRIRYSCNTGWADTIRIHDVAVPMSSFPRDYAGQYVFETGDFFGSLGPLPLYLSLNPGVGSAFVKMH